MGGGGSCILMNLIVSLTFPTTKLSHTLNALASSGKEMTAFFLRTTERVRQTRDEVLEHILAVDISEPMSTMNLNHNTDTKGTEISYFLRSVNPSIG